jgi:hypothetical protein
MLDPTALRHRTVGAITLVRGTPYFGVRQASERGTRSLALGGRSMRQHAAAHARVAYSILLHQDAYKLRGIPSLCSNARDQEGLSLHTCYSLRDHKPTLFSEVLCATAKSAQAVPITCCHILERPIDLNWVRVKPAQIYILVPRKKHSLSEVPREHKSTEECIGARNEITCR